MKPLSDCRLYAFVDTAYLHGRPPEILARQLCAGGADLIQLRAKNSDQSQILDLARRLLPITRQAGVGLVINDFPSIACEIGAQLCHLGQEDFFGAGYTNVRQLSSGTPPLSFGLSTHSPDQATRALSAQPAYLAIGPVYATQTKPSAKPVTLEYVRWAAAHVNIPWFAIGGITLQNLEAVLAAGARRVCVVSAILSSTDVTETCRAFKDRLLAALTD